MEIKLYTTLGCHLCEQALTMLETLNQNHPDVSIDEIEIGDSEELLARYGIRIPVIAINNGEIGWPFTLDELKMFIHDHTNQSGNPN